MNRKIPPITFKHLNDSFEEDPMFDRALMLMAKTFAKQNGWNELTLRDGIARAFKDENLSFWLLLISGLILPTFRVCMFMILRKAGTDTGTAASGGNSSGTTQHTTHVELNINNNDASQTYSTRPETLELLRLLYHANLELNGNTAKISEIEQRPSAPSMD